MTDSPVLYHKQDSIVTLTLNRPATLNAMNEAMLAELERWLVAVAADTTVRVVVLTGAGRAFSSVEIRSVRETMRVSNPSLMVTSAARSSSV